MGIQENGSGVCNLKKLKNVVGLCKEEDAWYCKTGINLSLYYIVLCIGLYTTSHPLNDTLYVTACHYTLI